MYHVLNVSTVPHSSGHFIHITTFNIKQFDVMNYYGYFPSPFILLTVFIDMFLTFPLSPVLTFPN